MRSPQFWSVVTLLFATLLVIQRRGFTDQVPPSAPLNEMPISFGSWTGRDLPISAATLEILGKGDFLNRVYSPEATSPNPLGPGPRSRAIPVQLFIAYFPTQRSGQSIHSPQNCLPGSGWTFLSSGVAGFRDRTGTDYKVGDYVISDGREKQEVLYWYQTHGRSIANDYAAKAHMLVDSIRLGRTDAALVRVITPIAADEDEAQAHDRLIGFAKLVTPTLPAYVPN